MKAIDEVINKIDAELRALEKLRPWASQKFGSSIPDGLFVIMYSKKQVVGSNEDIGFMHGSMENVMTAVSKYGAKYYIAQRSDLWVDDVVAVAIQLYK